MTELSPEIIAFPDSESADFMRETDYRLAVFLDFGKTLQGSRIALYGSGANTRHILEAESRCFDVMAVVDDSAVGKRVGTMTVLSLDDALSQGIEVLVIAAEFASVDVAYRRISERCQRAEVRVFDMYGNDCSIIETATSNAIKQLMDCQLEIIDSCDSICINMSLFLEDCSRFTVAECVRAQGDVSQCLSSLIEYELARGKNVAYYSFSSEINARMARALLDQAGLVGTGPLFLTTETGLFAENGLYRLMYECLPAGSTVHIGPDILRDGVIPLRYGKGSVVTGELEMSNSIRLADLENETTPQGSWYETDPAHAMGSADMRLASCARAILPTIADTVGASTSQVVGIVAPLVIGFVTWLVNQFAKSAGSYDEVLFVSRDGYLVKEAYDICRNLHDAEPLPVSRYFYTSRKASRAALASDEERKGSLSYFAACGLKPGKTYAFVEFVGAGTCQRQLGQFAPFCLSGFYFGSRVGGYLTRKLDSQLYFEEKHVSFFSRYLVLEPYLSADEASLNGFDCEGKPVFDAEYRTPQELTILRDVHKGVALFAREYFERWYEEGDVIAPSFVDSIMPYLDLCDTGCMKLVDDLSGRVLTKVVDDPMPTDKDVDFASSTGDSLSKPLCQLLGVLDAVCEEFGLTYVATHGTLLGAIREGGFVAGDDDIDVAMPRADYDALINLAAGGVFPEPLFLQTPENDDEHFSGGYAQLRNRAVKVVRPKDYRHFSSEDVWIDILPLDNCPVDDKEVEKRQRIVRTWQRLLYAKTYRNFEQIWDADPRKASAYFLLADLMSRSTLCRGLRASCTEVKPTGLLTCFAGNYRRKANRVRFAEADVAHAVRISFEDTTIPVPRNAEKWLDLYYGDSWREVREAGE